MPHPNDLLTVSQLAKELKLDQRTIKRVASQLGGRRFGNRWRFKWGTVLEYFNNADIEKKQGQQVDGACDYGRQTSRVQNVPGWQEVWPGVEGCETMGGRAKKSFENICSQFSEAENSLQKSGNVVTGRGKSTSKSTDPNGLREAFFLGRYLS